MPSTCWSTVNVPGLVPNPQSRLFTAATYEKFHRGNVLFGKLERDVLEPKLPPPPDNEAGCGCSIM